MAAHSPARGARVEFTSEGGRAIPLNLLCHFEVSTKRIGKLHVVGSPATASKTSGEPTRTRTQLARDVANVQAVRAIKKSHAARSVGMTATIFAFSA